MIECSRCRNNCENAGFKTFNSINTAEFCEFIVEKIRNLATKKLCILREEWRETFLMDVFVEQIPYNHIVKHLTTISEAKDFWHNEDLFEEPEGIPDDEVGEDEDEFWAIFDGLVDELFQVRGDKNAS